MTLEAEYQPIVTLGQSLRIARKRRGLRIVDLARSARCSQDTLRRLENGDPGVSIGVLARVMATIGCAQELASLMDAAKDSDGLEAEVRRLPQRVRRPLLPVERVSAEQFWADKQARQASSHDRIASGEIPQSALFAFSKEQLRNARFRWPKSAFPAPEGKDEEEERSASTLQR